MFLMRILPGVLKELLKHVPTVLFDAVEWSELASEVPKLTKKLMQKEGFVELFKEQKTFLSPLNVELVETELKNETLSVNKDVAKRWLTLYFAQLFSPHGVFLDLRSHNFSNHNEILRWHPTGLWHKFSEPFRKGLINIYDGFYLGNEELYHQGLIELGLADVNWSAEDKAKLANLFKEQFGASLGEEMSFDLEGFRNSLVKITDFLLQKKVKISTDFLYLGIYLVLLYSSLEKSKEKLPVKQIYLDVRNKLIQ
jgi:hypothetical protein